MQEFVLKKADIKSKRAFETLYNKHYKEVLLHAAYISGNSSVAEDYTQEAFAKLYETKLMHSNPVGWLKKTVSNMIYNYFRNQKIHRKKEEGLYEDKIISIEDAALQNLEAINIKKVLNSLDERDRMCILLKSSGYKYREIAEIVGVEYSSVGKLIQRAQAKFKELYEKGAN